MRLCIATPLYPPESGGPATYVKALEEGLSGLGCDISIVKFSDVRALPKLQRHVAYFFRVLRAGKEADVILALDPVSVGLPAALAAGLLRKPFVVKIVGDYAWEQGTQRSGLTVSLDKFVRMGRVPFFVAVLRSVQTFVAHRARLVIVPSQYLKGIIMAWGIDAGKIEVIYNAISLEGAIAKQSLPARTVVSVARLVPWKGMRGLIDAMKIVRTTVSDAVLVIIGEGPERAALEAYAQGDPVQFLGARTHAEVLAYMNAADAFALNSTYEGLSHVLIEALMLGRPVVASAAGGNPELITDEQNGLLAPVSDTHALAGAITRLLTDASLAERLSKNAALSARERFSPATMLQHTHSVLLHL